MYKALLFDLDDTLYQEMAFVKSGFKEVAKFISSRHKFDEGLLFDEMNFLLERNGRGRIFDSLLDKIGLYSEEWVKMLLYVYRSHKPDIKPFKDVVPFLLYLRRTGIRTGIITDGLAPVQQNKVNALKLDGIFDFIIYTDTLGKEYSKPSELPFLIALELLRGSIETPEDTAYAGNDVLKDFIAPNSLGMDTIEIRRVSEGAEGKVVQCSEMANAKHTFADLTELYEKLFNS
ncbi:MAG: HAD hydrolase-like protein [Nitrospirae bacterium]|nr:HAD hydrolase-like protein [Nitrospirota bacterium]